MRKEGWRMVKKDCWNRYKKIMSDLLEWDGGRERISWGKEVNEYVNDGEDDRGRYYNIGIEGLWQQNGFRNWGINKGSVCGELDDEKVCIVI